jgi:hypothetical protein
LFHAAECDGSCFNVASIFSAACFGLAVGLEHRNGQATVVKTGSATVSNPGLIGAWTVTANKSSAFTIDVASSGLLNLSSFGVHWGFLTDIPELN